MGLPEAVKAVVELLIDKTKSGKVQWEVDQLGDDYYYAVLPEYSISLTEDKREDADPAITASIRNEEGKRIFRIHTEGQSEYGTMKALLEAATANAQPAPDVLDGLKAYLKSQ